MDGEPERELGFGLSLREEDDSVDNLFSHDEDLLILFPLYSDEIGRSRVSGCLAKDASSGCLASSLSSDSVCSAMHRGGGSVAVGTLATGCELWARVAPWC